MATKTFFNNKSDKKDFTERLKEIRVIPDSCNSLEYRNQCYEKYKAIVPIDKFRLQSYSDQEIQDILIAEQIIWRDKILHRLQSGANLSDEPNYQDLVYFLEKPIGEAWKSDTELAKTAQGLDFLKDYVRPIIYKTRVKGKYSDPTKNVDDIRAFHRAICMCYILNQSIDRISISKLATVIQLTGSVLVVSNFRPLSAAAIWQRYAIEKFPNEKEINILAPSEGFFGRLLSSYYIAYKNRDKIINYHSFDPNTELTAPSESLIKLLKNYGNLNKVTNWNLTIHWHGSEVPEADLHKSLGIKFHTIFTSPPYGLHELYVSTADIYLGIPELSMQEINEFIQTKNQIPNKTHILKVSDSTQFKTGQQYTHNNITYTVLKVDAQTQSHSKVKTTDAWRELFFRETVRNCKAMLLDEGYMIWNVANTRTYPTLEADVLQVCNEEGFNLVETLHYTLSRRPGENSRLKPPFEPVFVFQKRV